MKILTKTKLEEEERAKIERKEKDDIEALQSEIGQLEYRGQLKRFAEIMKPMIAIIIFLIFDYLNDNIFSHQKFLPVPRHLGQWNVFYSKASVFEKCSLRIGERSEW